MKNVYTLEAQVFASLANPKRLEILHLLQHGQLTVGQIVEMTNIAQANVSQHLAVLRRLGLVSSQKNAQTRVYCLASTHVSRACEFIRRSLLERYGAKGSEALNSMRLHVDPICGMQLSAHNVTASIVQENKRYYFCGQGCYRTFLRQMDKNKFI